MELIDLFRSEGQINHCNRFQISLFGAVSMNFSFTNLVFIFKEFIAIHSRLYYRVFVMFEDYLSDLNTIR